MQDTPGILTSIHGCTNAFLPAEKRFSGNFLAVLKLPVAVGHHSNVLLKPFTVKGSVAYPTGLTY